MVRSVVVALVPLLLTPGCEDGGRQASEEAEGSNVPVHHSPSTLVGPACGTYASPTIDNFDPQLLLTAEYIQEEGRCYAHNPPQLDRLEYGCGELLFLVDQELGNVEALAEAIGGAMDPKDPPLARERRCKTILIRVPAGSERGSLQHAWGRPEVVLFSLNSYATVTF